MGFPSRSILVVLVVVGAGCTFPALTTPTPRPSPSPTAVPTPSPTPSPAPSPSAPPTPDAVALPAFTAGEIVATAIDGLRVRQRPGLASVVVTGLLPLGAELQAVMGPILVDERGWYLVADADPGEPQFQEGWISTGTESEPFLRATGRTSDSSPFVASFAFVGDAEYGPIDLPDEHHAIRWVAADPERRRCQFSVLLAAGDEEPIPAIRATIGNDVVPGTLQPTFFRGNPELRGQTFLTVRSDCAWALVVTRLPEPADHPSPTLDT